MHRRDLIKKMIMTGSFLPLVPSVAFSRMFAFENRTIERASFPAGFKWGAVTGNNPVTKAGKDNNAHFGELKNRYMEEVRLMALLNFPVYTFSFDWSAILPYGIGQRNQEGIDLYHRVIDTCLENNIEPWVTLCHGNLPEHLENKGGWETREVIDWFSEFIDTCTREYGSKTRNWTIMNEPARMAGMGHFNGHNISRKRGFKSFLRAAHHAAICQAEGGRLVRSSLPTAHIGTTQFATAIEPKNSRYRHQKANDKLDALLNRFFIEPLMGMGYPVNDFPFLQYIEKYFSPGR
jgi:beta-glucosidase